MTKIVLLIPAYRPAKVLPELLRSVREAEPGIDIVVVNDGSGPDFQPVFDSIKTSAGCHVIEHAVNLGKGRAIKSGINYICTGIPGAGGVVTADADGQHSAASILRVIKGFRENPGCLVLGSRSFSGRVPFRSLVGNVLTRYLLNMIIGTSISDTQTGLRAIPEKMFSGILRTPGERYEFETNMLILCRDMSVKIHEVNIDTIYIDNNAGSHFNPFFDSVMIYFQLLRFSLSSLFTALVDYLLFVVLFDIIGIRYAIIAARFFASLFNFAVNRKIVFKSDASWKFTVVKYYLLVVLLGFAAYFLIEAVVETTGMPVVLAKAVVELVLFVASFSIQRDLVFANKRSVYDEK